MKRARAAFMAGSVVIGLGGLGHLIAHITEGDPDPQLMAVHAAMRTYVVTMAGMQFNVLDVMNGFEMGFALLALLVGIGGILISGAAETPPALLRRLALLQMLGAGSIIGMVVYYRVAPPLLVFSVAFVLFATSWVLSLIGDPRR
jgi:hypothetical protein